MRCTLPPCSHTVLACPGVLQGLARPADVAPPTVAERRRFYCRTTSEALQEARQHQHTGAHPYRVVLGEVRSAWGSAAAGLSCPLQGVCCLLCDSTRSMLTELCSWASCMATSPCCSKEGATVSSAYTAMGSQNLPHLWPCTFAPGCKEVVGGTTLYRTQQRAVLLLSLVACCLPLCCQVRRKLMNTRRRMEEMLQGNMDSIISGDGDDWYASEEELAQPLLAVYW